VGHPSNVRFHESAGAPSFAEPLLRSEGRVLTHFTFTLEVTGYRYRAPGTVLTHPLLHNRGSAKDGAPGRLRDSAEGVVGKRSRSPQRIGDAQQVVFRIVGVSGHARARRLRVGDQSCSSYSAFETAK
jgi:hypothetical protein